MKKFMAIVVQPLFILLFVEVYAQPAEKATCKNFLIVFEEKVKYLPPFIYANGKQIGMVDLAQNQVANSNQVPVCIESKHAGQFEKNTTCYVSNDQIVVYNVWSTGIDLKEGESVKGFSGRFGLYFYEAQELFMLIRDAVTAFILELITKVTGESSVVKAKNVYQVLTN